MAKVMCTETSSFALLWHEHLAPKKPKAPRVGVVRKITGETIDLFAWLEKAPEPPVHLPEGDWRDDERMQAYLHEAILWDALHLMVDGKSSKQFEQNLDWLLSNEVHPFSYRVCASYMMVDFEEYREEALHVLKERIIAKEKKSIAQIVFLQDIVLQKHLEALAVCREGTAGYEASFEWLFNDSDTDSLSFIAVCKDAGLNPVELRNQVVEQRRRKYRTIASVH